METIHEYTRRFKDPIHDYIPFGPLVCSVIDTKHFQRLRNIKQLGVSYYVWPGASHNRFEHCLGVAYLARRMAEHLKHSQPSLGITESHVQCIELAGLCHDLGHGPLSHVWDNMFIPMAMKGKRWKHEDASEMMFDHMVKKYELDINPDDATFIKALIAGDTSRCKLGETMPFLFEIVANKRNGIDVDKFDYIARDCHAIGEKGNLSLTRLIHSARVIENEICYDIKDSNQVYELCYTRFSLHKRIYNHKTATAIEYMLIDALLAADPIMKIAALVDNPDKYLYLTDNILTRIEMSTEEELQHSRDIIERVRCRDLYRLVDFKVFPWDQSKKCLDYITPECIFQAAQTNSFPDIDADDIAKLTSGHIIVHMSRMHYGMSDKNPLDFVKFYSKHSPNMCRHADPGDISLLMPSSFGEGLLRVYTKEKDLWGIVQAAFRVVLSTMPISTDDATNTRMSETLTPPLTEACSTPRTLSRVTSSATVAGSGSEPRPGSRFMDIPPGSPIFSKTKKRRGMESETLNDSPRKKKV
ncbi:hypothetical protein BJ138DRAFT_1098348 [Hygrophoropsis aurantiaca]|uniref:Uncharacterized protein n=1 Tax=Hygrophoropsis aurantiaca TaxID=72124 RepID=A0ACB8AMW6_9AGAM|nr:hypothetical protein BJ138DRAFT_1098348 [Hygrophoropsis aurantiaca]